MVEIFVDYVDIFSADNGIVHRDIKVLECLKYFTKYVTQGPNMLLTKDGVVKLAGSEIRIGMSENMSNRFWFGFREGRNGAE